MAWCPQCKEEYEDNVTMCADCNVDLVASLEDISTERMLLVLNTLEEGNKAIEFLKYSKIKSGQLKEAKNEHGEHVFVVYVDDGEWSKATKVMQGFVMTEKEEPNMEDYYFDEYETLDFDDESKISEIKSSYMSFLLIGGVIGILGILHLANVLSMFSGNMPIMFTVIGIIFVLIGLYTKQSLGSKEEEATSKQDEFNSLYEQYISKYPIEGFYRRKKIKLDNLDEGAKYFALMDGLVKEIKSMKITESDPMINTIAEKVYNELD